MQNKVLQKWDEVLASSQTSLKENVLKEFVTKDFGYFLLEIHQKEMYRLYIRIEDRGMDVDFDFKGVNIYKVFHSIYNSHYLVIENKRGKSPHIFKLFTVDLIEKLSDTSIAKEEKIRDVIYDWQEFFKHSSLEHLSTNAEKGLFGELLLIDELIENYQLDILLGWSGPEKSTLDFLFKQMGVEVKTTESVGSPVITISSIEQLDDRVREDVYLKVYRLYKEGLEGRTLVELVQRITRKIETNRGRIIFESKLARVGYYPEHALLYQTRWGVRKSSTYHIASDFPRLRKDRLPIGICDVSYKINLANCTDYLIDDSTIYTALGEG